MKSTEYICPKCGKELSTFPGRYEIDKFLEPYGMCEACYIKSKGLVKVGRHYVSWDCLFHPDTNEACNPPEDGATECPKFSWDEEHNKFKFAFYGADCGGYDVVNYVWYYDSVDDFLMDIGVTGK